MMQAATRDLNIAYAFFERNWNLTRRYIGWEVVWLIYSLVNALTILFIAAATERITGQSVDTRFFVLYLLIGTTMWSYLSAVFDVLPKQSPGNAGKARSNTHSWRRCHAGCISSVRVASR